MNSTKVLGRGLQHMGTGTHECIILYSILWAFSLVKFTDSFTVLSFMNAMKAVTHCILRIFGDIMNSQSETLVMTGSGRRDLTWLPGFCLRDSPSSPNKYGNPRNGKVSTSWTRVIRGVWVCVSGRAFRAAPKRWMQTWWSGFEARLWGEAQSTEHVNRLAPIKPPD